MREKNRETAATLRRVDFWPFFTWRRDMEQKERLQALALLEPFFPSNRSIERDYSQLWSFWRAEKNGETGAASQSLLWNLYRRESGPGEQKNTRSCSGFFSINPAAKAHTGACATFHLEKSRGTDRHRP